MLRSRKRRRHAQITCVCTAYTFPHRLGGGKCSGSEWAASYREVVNTMCGACNAAYDTYGCEVADGRESIGECEGYQELLLRPTAVRLPRSLEEYMENQYSRRYEYNESD